MFMYFAMLKPFTFKVSYHAVNITGSGRKTERPGIGHHTGIQTFCHCDIDLVIITRIFNKIIHHFAGAAFSGIT